MRGIKAARILSARAEADPLRHGFWLPGQHRFLTSNSKRRLYRTGNQHSGKTYAGCAEMRFRADGTHPFHSRAPIKEGWIICASWSQSVAIQQKYYDIAKGSLVEDTVFNPKTGFGQHNPTAIHKSGALVRFKTVNQGALNLASATIDVAMFDEPPTSPRVYEEVKKRLLKRNGDLLLTMTPVNAGPMDWLKELADSGQIEDIHVRLAAENMIPVGWSTPMLLDDGTPCDESWIEAVRADTMPHEAPVVLDGEWEMRATGRIFQGFNELHHVTSAIPAGRWDLCLGIDYGSKVGKQVAVLAMVDASGDYPRVHVLDETIGDEMTSSADDARAILEMLRRNNYGWHSLDQAWGDRVYMRGAEKKSNRDTMTDLARMLGLKGDAYLYPRLRTVKRGEGRGQGSKGAGVRWLHQAMVRRGCFTIDPKAQGVIEAIQRWDWSDDEMKDRIDALRYALWDHTFRMRAGLAVVPRLSIR